METLNAISGMLESLKNNKIFPLQQDQNAQQPMIRRERSSDRLNKSMKNPPTIQSV